ncbi:MAG TPA: hypothetical protein V6C81_11650 [Planktothrix sp.]
MEATTVDYMKKFAARIHEERKQIFVEGAELSVDLSAAEYERAEAVNHSMLNIKLIHCQLEAHMCNMDKILNGVWWNYYSRPRDEEFQQHRISEVRRGLSEFVAWHLGAMSSVWMSEYSTWIRPQRKVFGERVLTAKECKKLYDGTARIIHQLQHMERSPFRDKLAMKPFRGETPPPLGFSDRELDRVLAEYSLFIAQRTVRSLGPVGDNRYRHADKPKWARIEARSLEHLRLVVERDIKERVGGDDGVEANKKLSAALRKAARTARSLADQGEQEQLAFAAEDAEYNRQLAELQSKRLAS